MPFAWILVVVLLFAVLAIETELTLLGVFSAYAVSGPLMWLLSCFKRKKSKVSPDAL